jgi:hypothetical protein
MATESDNVNSGALATLLFVGAFATLGIALVVTALVRSETTDEAEKKEIGADRPYRDLVAEQTAKMDSPAAYLDRAKGSVSLPISRAMELVVTGLSRDPSSATPAAVGGGGGAASTAPTAIGGTATEAGGGAGGATKEATPAEGAKPGEEKKDSKDDKKKAAPKPHVPAAPAPAAPAAPAPAAPAPAPAP